MYESPSYHFELAKQRHRDVLQQAKADALVAQAKAEQEPVDHLRRVRGVFAGINAAVSGFTSRTRAPQQQPGLNPA